jgi:hypothetical protein
MKRALQLLSIIAAVSLLWACSDDDAPGSGADGDVGVDVTSQGDVEPDPDPDTSTGDADTSGGDDVGADAAADASEADAGPDADDDTQLVTTAVVVHSDADAGTSSYQIVQRWADGEVITAGSPVDFGDGHVLVNATEHGVYLIDWKSGRVRVLAKDDTAAGLTYEHLGDVELQSSGDGDFATQPQWVGESQDGRFLVVSLFASGELAKVPVDWDTGTVGSPSFFDLSAHDDDGNPDPTVVLTDGDYALVALQRLDEQRQPVKDGQILVWDIDNEQAHRVVDVSEALFHAGMKWLPGGDLAAGLAGEVGAEGDPTLDAGVQRLTRSAAGSYAADTDFLISEQLLQGDLWGFEFLDDERGYAVVRGSQRLQLLEFDANLGGAQPQVALIDSIGAPTGWIEIADQSQVLWAAADGDSNTSGGLFLVDTHSGDLVDHLDALSLGLAGTPTSFAITESVRAVR